MNRKIAIIGAGINGLYLAWKLSEKKEKVIVFERRNKIGKQACSGLFSQKILKFIPQSSKLVEKEIKSVLIHFPKKTIKVKFSESFLIINHFKLDNLVADLAKKAGAKIILSQIDIDKKNIFSCFDRVIGSDGANSSVRKWLNVPKQKFFLGIQGLTDEQNDNNYVETWPTKNGFIWKIPRGKETEWGIMEKPDKAKRILDQFLNQRKVFLRGLKSALIPLNFSVSKNKSNFSSKTTLCGDAAGLVKPWSGGGVVWGLIAADLLLNNFPCFLKYEKKTSKFFSPKIIFSKIAVKTIYFLGFYFPWIIPKNIIIKDDFLI